MAVVTNAETVPVVAPTLSTDGATLTGTVDIKGWTGSCNGTQYGATVTVAPGATANVTGVLIAPNTPTTFFVNASNTAGAGTCISKAYTYVPNMIPAAPSIGNIVR